MKSEDPRHLVLSIIGVLSFAAVIGYVLARLGVPFAGPVAIVGAISAAVVFRGKPGPAIARLLRRAPEASDDTTGQLLAEMDALRGRVQELEERVDFSERLLARHQSEPQAVGPGGKA